MNRISECLQQSGFCWRCIKRFSADRSNTTMYKIGVQECVSSHCGSCLGILQEKQVKNVLKQVCDSINQRHYESEDFNLAISLPQCLLLRQKASLAFIRTCHKKSGIELPSELGSVLVKDVLKYVLLEAITEATKKKYTNKSELLVNLIYKYSNDEREVAPLEPLLPNQQSKQNKRKFNQRHMKNHHNKTHPLNCYQNIHDVVQKLNDADLSRYTSVPPQTLAEPVLIAVDTCQGSLFLAGRYNKYSRTLSQTPWFVDGVRKTESSVQELICKRLKDHVVSKEAKFLSSGREDVDVKMLGTGRPFVTELIDPQKINLSQEEVSQLQRDINSSTELIAVRDLQVVDRDGLSKLKQGEEEKTKSYSAKLWCPENIPDRKLGEISSLKMIKLTQKTPLRVLHRRPLMTREKTVHQLTITRLDDDHYKLQIVTQAGTYIKEFVHSDFGRTIPSLRSLLDDAPIDIIELDVDAVELDWPPSVSVK